MGKTGYRGTMIFSSSMPLSQRREACIRRAETKYLDTGLLCRNIDTFECKNDGLTKLYWFPNNRKWNRAGTIRAGWKGGGGG